MCVFVGVGVCVCDSGFLCVSERESYRERETRTDTESDRQTHTDRETELEMLVTVFFCRRLTDVGHVDAVRRGGGVAAGGRGRHRHAVHLPDGCVTAVEVAAVGPAGHVVGTLVDGPLAVEEGDNICIEGILGR